MIILTFPFSLLVCFKVVTEYERAVIFRLGRLKKGGSLGPGLHFELPCIEHVEVVDMRTSKMRVPPQEVNFNDNPVLRLDIGQFNKNSLKHL